jgi:membrane-bound ClpP family serine protease
LTQIVTRVEKVIWPLIFVGVLLIGLGISLHRTDESAGTVVGVVGIAMVLLGAVLLWVRSRMRDARPERD